MKRFINGFFVALVIGALASISAFAAGKDEKRTVTFPSDVMVNGTLLKAGEYQVKFDESSKEVTITKNGKVKAKVPAHLESRNEKARDTAVRTREEGGTVQLIGFSFGGSNQDVVISGGSSATGTP